MLYCYDNLLTHLDVSECEKLQDFKCQNNQLQTINLGNLPYLLTFHCFNNQLTTLDVAGCEQLQNLACFSNLLETLDVTSNSFMSYLACSDNVLTSLNISGLTLTSLDCYENSLVSIRAVNSKPQEFTSYQFWNLSNNEMSASALNQFFTDLAEEYTSGTQIDVSNNPGVSGDDPSIAANKGYIILGSD
jgi:hypothetical protein